MANSNVPEPGPDGLYSVCVQNAEDCSMDKIKDIFKQFGEVSKVHVVKNMVFVRYPSFEEAKNCVDSMRGHQQFRVNFGKKKRDGPPSTSGRWEGPSASSSGRWEREKDGRPDSDGFGRRSNSSNSSGRHAGEGGGDCRPLPKLVPYPPPPPVVESSQPPEVAKVVIIGNLDPQLGQNQIYELCTKAGAPPLHVALKSIRRPDFPKVQYAMVYVRTSEQVNSLIASFTNLKLNGYPIVVDTVENYIEKGKALRAKNN